ncbi:MAG TPA: hypothetical protein VFS24_07070 [Steroidobacteraceae bacterium]|nr:hypothetical protein [Steroidobacteraceae bacterium]
MTHTSSPRTLPRSQGQIAPIALFGVLIASAVLVLMFNNGQRVTEKSLVANAADAAAYSGAVWTARHLNFMAYTNRAMIANHVAVGHFVSYVSWIRYINDSIDFIDRIAQWIPYVGEYVDYVQEVAQYVRDITDDYAAYAVPAMDAWNATFRAAQMEAQASLAVDHLSDLMQQTARTYDPDIRINDRGEMSRMPSEVQSVLEAQVFAQLANVPAFVQRYYAGEDRNSIRELIDASLHVNNDMQRWAVGERGWRETLLSGQIRKRGSTTNSQTRSGADWNAKDDLQTRTRSLFGWHSWRRVGDDESKASATEFDSDYAGVPSYYNVAGNPSDRSLRIVALATKRQANVMTANLLGMVPLNQPLAAAATAAIEFHRASGGLFDALASNSHEYASLFNPFWDAHLVANSFSR